MNGLSTFIFLIIRIISNPIANALQKRASYTESPLIINFYTYLFLSLFCVPLFINYNSVHIYNFDFVCSVVFAGFLCSAGVFCLIKAMNQGELSVLGPINSYKSVIGLISAFFILGEVPSLIGCVGIVLIILGSYFIFDTQKEGFSFSLFMRRDIQLRFLALVLTGIEAAVLKHIILLSNIQICFIYWCFSGLLWSFVFILFNRHSFDLSNKNIIKDIFFIAICMGLMQYSTNFVFNSLDVGLSLALFQLSSLVTVFLGYKMFNEQNIIKKIIGTLIMILGSCLIFNLVSPNVASSSEPPLGSPFQVDTHKNSISYALLRIRIHSSSLRCGALLCNTSGLS